MENKIIYKKIELNIIQNIEELLPKFYVAQRHDNRPRSFYFEEVDIDGNGDLCYEYEYSGSCGYTDTEWLSSVSVLELIKNGKSESGPYYYYVNKEDAENKIEDFKQERIEKERLEKEQKERKEYAILKAKFETEGK